MEQNEEPGSLASPLAQRIAGDIRAAGGWIGFDRFMALALYEPGLGYYARHAPKFGAMPQSGSDFVTAPELTPLFGHTLAVQVEDALAATGTAEVWEFGAGSGVLAAQLLESLGGRVARYTIVELSATLRERQQQRLAAWGDRVRWADALPDRIEGVLLGNEVLDAMPVQLLARVGGVWHERGVALHAGAFAFADVPTALRPPTDVAGAHDYLTEIHPQAQAFVRTVGERLARGCAFFIDYGFGEAEYYHPQRHMGTVMCHRGHRADGNPLVDVGEKDITAHVDFTGIAVAAQDAGLAVLGYTSQARFLFNCGLLSKLELAGQSQRALAARLVHEHEMGTLFNVIALGAGTPPGWSPIGFAEGDLTHRL